MQADTLSQSVAAETPRAASSASQRTKQPTPAQVLKWLPKNATPAQQDSAIQAHVKPRRVCWSQMPDTLHLPGQPVGKSFRNVTLPQYYRESFFSNDSLFHPELNGGRVGVAGDPVPYTVSGDNLITGVLLGCFILAMLAFSRSKRFLEKQVKTFFYQPRGRTTEITETGEEIRFQLFFVFQSCLLSALLFFFYSRTYVTDIFVLEYYQIIGIYTAAIVLYFMAKTLAYAFVNWVFFDREKNEQWMRARLFLVSVEGVALFPIVMLLSYFDVSMKSAVIYAAVVIVLIKLLTLYKAYAIFFRQAGAFLQIILYFCALEIIPMLALWGVFGLANNHFKINF